MNRGELPADIEYMILNEIFSTWHCNFTDEPLGRYDNRYDNLYDNPRSWTEIHMYQLVCSKYNPIIKPIALVRDPTDAFLGTWRKYLAGLLVKNLPVHVLIEYCDGSVALWALELFIESVSSKRPAHVALAPWQTSDGHDLIHCVVDRNFTRCIQLLLDLIPEEQRETFWKQHPWYSSTLPPRAAGRGHCAALETLSSYGLHLDRDGGALSNAVENNQVDTARYLIQWSSQNTHRKPFPKQHLNFRGYAERIASHGTVPMMQLYMEPKFGFNPQCFPLSTLLERSHLFRNLDMSKFLADMKKNIGPTTEPDNSTFPVIKSTQLRVRRWVHR